MASICINHASAVYIPYTVHVHVCIHYMYMYMYTDTCSTVCTHSEMSVELFEEARILLQPSERLK